MASIRLPAAILAVLGLALGAAASGPAPAQASGDIRLAQAASFTDDQLQSFAVAALEVRDIRTRYMGEIQAAGSQEEQEQLVQQAQQEMLGAVESTPGISVEDYNAIIQATSNDPELAEKVKGMIAAAAE